MFILFQATTIAKVLKLPLVSYRGQEAFSSTYVLLTVAANFEPLLVVLQTDVGAELLDITAEPGGNVGLRLPCLEVASPD